MNTERTYWRICKESGEQTEISESEVRSKLANAYHDVNSVLDAIDLGLSAETSFAIYERKH